MKKIKVLFLCIHNSARSQMAEAFLKKSGNSLFEATSAGLEPGKLNPLAVQVMQEEGIDISMNGTKDVFNLHQEGKTFDLVITVCDAKNSERCPVFPGLSKKIAWDFDDPSSFAGTADERLSQTRMVKEKIKQAVSQLVNEYTNKVS